MPPKFGGGPKCAQCLLAAYPFESVSYSGSVYHSACFCCQLCKQRITNVVSVTELKGAVFHKNCYARRLQAAGGKIGAGPLNSPPKGWLVGVNLGRPLDSGVAVRVFNDFDRDRDGFLDNAEATLFVEEWCKQLAIPFTPAVLDSFFATFDANKDGRISKIELLGEINHVAPTEAKTAQPEPPLVTPPVLEVKSAPPPPPPPVSETKIEQSTNVLPPPIQETIVSTQENHVEVVEAAPLALLAEQQTESESAPNAYNYAVSEESGEEVSHYATYSNYGSEEMTSTGNYDDIATVNEEKKSIAAPPDRTPLVNDATFQWQERFEAILDMPSQTPKAKLEKAKALQALNSEFCEQAKLLARELVRDSFLPRNERVYKALSGMGVAGGEKYLAKGMFIKMPKDLGLGIYGGDMGAGKAAKHEINSLQALLDCDIPQLFFPLMCCVTYQGFRLVCSSLISGLGKNTLAYGSQDAGFTIHCSDPDLNNKVEQACTQLGLAAHNSISHDKKCQLLYGPADLEGHVIQIGQKKKMYLLDFARLMPPESPHRRKGTSVNAIVYLQDGTTRTQTTDSINAFVVSVVTGSGVLKRTPLSEGILFFREPSDEAKNVLASELANREIKSAAVLVSETGRIFYELLRPEAVKTFGRPLSSDAFSGFGSCKFCFGVTNFCPHGGQIHNANVADATDYVVHTLAAFARRLENRTVNLADCPTLVRELHRVGINLRWLGSLLEHVSTPYIKRLIFMEMVCRTVRQVLAAKQRRIVETAARQGVKLEVLEENLKLAGLEVFNMVLGNSENANSFWDKDLGGLLRSKYFRTKQADSADDVYFASEKNMLGRDFLLKFPLFSRLQQIACFKFTPEVNQRLFQDPSGFDKESPFVIGDVVGCEVQVQRLQFDESINLILHELAHFKDNDDELRPSLIRAMSFKTEVASARMVFHQMALDTFGPEHPYVIDSFFKLSLDLRRTHSIDLALKMATQGLKCCIKTYGSFSHQYVMGLTTMGEIEMEAMLYPAAILTFGQALERANRIHGGRESFHPLVAKLCAYLGRLNMLHGDKHSGALYLGRSFSVYEQLYGRKVSDYLTPVVTMGKGEQIGTALAEMAFAIRSVCDENGMIEEGEVQDGVLMLAGDLAKGLPPGPALSGVTIIERIRTVVTIIEDIDGVPRGYFMVDSDESPSEPTPSTAEAKSKADKAPPPLEGSCGVCSIIPEEIVAGVNFTFWVRSFGTVTCSVGPETKTPLQPAQPVHLYDVIQGDQAVPPSVYTASEEGSAYNYTSGEDNAYTVLDTTEPPKQQESKEVAQTETKNSGGKEPEQGSAYNYTSGEDSAYTVLSEDPPPKQEDKESEQAPKSGQVAANNENPVGPPTIEPVNTDLPGIALELRPFVSRRMASLASGLGLYSAAFSLARVGRFTLTVHFTDASGPQSVAFPLEVKTGDPCPTRSQLRIVQNSLGFEFIVRARDAFGNCFPCSSRGWGDLASGNVWILRNTMEARVDARLRRNEYLPLTLPQSLTLHPNNVDFLVKLSTSNLRNNCNYTFTCLINKKPIRSCPVAFTSPESPLRYCNQSLNTFGGTGECFVTICASCVQRSGFLSKCVFCQRIGASTILRYCAVCARCRFSCYLCGLPCTPNTGTSGYARACDFCSVASKSCLGVREGYA